jgi:hypothetical protein
MNLIDLTHMLTTPSCCTAALNGATVLASPSLRGKFCRQWLTYFNVVMAAMATAVTNGTHKLPKMMLLAQTTTLKMLSIMAYKR